MSAARNLSPAPNLVPAKQRTQKPSSTIVPEPRHLELADGDLHLAKSLALADARNLVYRAKWTTQHDLADGWRYREMFAVPSYSQPGETHTVVWQHEERWLRCTCTAGSFLAPCSHAGAAFHAIRVIEGLMTRTEGEARHEQLLAEQFDEEARR